MKSRFLILAVSAISLQSLSAFASTTVYECTLQNVYPQERPAYARKISVSTKSSGKFSFWGRGTDGSNFECRGKLDLQNGKLVYGVVLNDRQNCAPFGGASTFGSASAGQENAVFFLKMNFQQLTYSCRKTSSSWW